MTTTLQAIGWLATAALGAAMALPADAHSSRRGNAASFPYARSTTTAPPPSARTYASAPAVHPHRHHHHHYSPPRVVVVPRPVYVAPPVVRYVAPPVAYAPAPVYSAPPAYADPPAYAPPAADPQGTPSGGWYQARGPFMALDGGSFIAGGVTYVLSGLRTWDVSTPQGAAARDRLQQLLQSGTVMVWRIANDGYGRAVSRVIVNGAEIPELLRREGLAAS